MSRWQPSSRSASRSSSSAAPTRSSLARTFSTSTATVRTPRAARASTCFATRARMARRPPCSTAPSICPRRSPPTTTNILGQSVLGTVSSSIAVPDSFMISGDQTAAGLSVMQVELDASFANDPDLTATLSHYDSSGDLLGTVTLFSSVGTGTRTANFTNTVFDDNATTPIQEGSAPFSAIYNPQESLATVFAPTHWHERPGDLDADNHEYGDGDDRYLQRLVVDLPEAACPPADWDEQGSDNASRQLPDLHAESERSRCRARSGRRSDRRRAPTRPARSTPLRWIPRIRRATRSMSAAPAAASGRRPTS